MAIHHTESERKRRVTDSLPPADELAAIRAEAVRIAAEAGGLLLDYFRRPLDIRFKSKDDRDPVSEADEAAERLLRAAILTRFPDHAVLGEETDAIAGNAESPYLWVLDPLDGTANFLNGLALWGVSVGVLHRGRPVVGAIFMPSGIAGAPAVLNAATGQGAAFDATPIDRTARASVRTRIGGLPGGYRPRVRTPQGARLGDARSLGSISIEMALAATGTLQYAMFWSPRLWDIAAGAVIAAEAGATVLLRGRQGWAAVERFDPPSASEGFRAWSQPLLVGDDNAVRIIAGVVPGRGWWARRLLMRLFR